MPNVEAIQKAICSSLCADVEVISQDDGLLYVSTPFFFPDGDAYSIYLEPLPTGGFRVTDMGNTLMSLSYENDLSKLRDGTRAKVFNQIISELDLIDDGGELCIETSADELGNSIFKFGQAITRVHDISFLNRVRVESTFYEDLESAIKDVCDDGSVVKDYAAPNVPDSQNYLADFAVTGGKRPLLIFGVPGSSQARLATIVMQYLQKHSFEFRSLVAYADMTALPRADISRLTNAANDQIAMFRDPETLRRKIVAGMN